jgi:hypothetical protein
MKKIDIKLKLSAGQKEIFSKRLLENRRLLFILLVGAVVIYTFNIVYKKAFVEVNFIEYASIDNPDSAYKEGAALDKIMQGIKDKEANQEKGRGASGKDPFNFAPEAGTDATTQPQATADSNPAAPVLTPRHAD